MTGRSVSQTHSIYITAENKQQAKQLDGLLEAVATLSCGTCLCHSLNRCTIWW